MQYKNGNTLIPINVLERDVFASTGSLQASSSVLKKGTFNGPADSSGGRYLINLHETRYSSGKTKCSSSSVFKIMMAHSRSYGLTLWKAQPGLGLFTDKYTI